MACEVRSMNSFRDAIYSGRGLHPKTPLVSEKEARGASEDDLGSVAIPRSEKRAANHRNDDRPPPTAEGGRVRHEGESHAVELVNLSAGGAMIRADFKPRMGEPDRSVARRRAGAGMRRPLASRRPHRPRVRP